MLKTGSLICFVIRGKHPVCGEPLFCFSANPDSLSELCGFHINHRSRSFLLKVSGVSSHLSFCCTSLVSGFIIQEDAQFVYSQSAQQIRHTFASKVQISGIHEFPQNFRAVCGRNCAKWEKPGKTSYASGFFVLLYGTMNGSRAKKSDEGSTLSGFFFCCSGAMNVIHICKTKGAQNNAENSA